MPKTYVITGANGDIAISMAEILRAYDPEARLIGTDIASQWPARSIFDDVIIVPPANRPNYVHVLENMMRDFMPRFIIPTSEPELRWIATHKDDFSNVPLLINDSGLILTCMDKLESMRFLERIGVTAPLTVPLHDAIADQLPLIVKPRFGAGSRGIEKVTTEERLHSIKQERDKDNVAQEFLDADNDEYTCAIVNLSSGSRILIMKRKLKEGVTFEMEAVSIPEIERLLQKISKHLPLHAAINVQLRLTQNGPMIFEINPRFSSTVKMRHLIGFSDFEWLLQDMNGEKVDECSPQFGRKVFRIYREVVAPSLEI